MVVTQPSSKAGDFIPRAWATRLDFIEILTRNSANSPTKRGGRSAWFSTRECIQWAGAATMRSSFSARIQARLTTISWWKWTDTSPGQGKLLPTSWDNSRFGSCARGRKEDSVHVLTFVSFTTPSLEAEPCRSICLKDRWMNGLARSDKHPRNGSNG